MPDFKIAVDAMGGDNAPGVEIEGAVQAASQYDIPIVLVGQEERIRAVLGRHETTGLSIDIVHASEVITMEDSAATAARKKKDSSIRVAARLMRDGAEVTEHRRLRTIGDRGVEFRARANGVDEVLHVELGEEIIACRVQGIALLRCRRLLDHLVPQVSEHPAILVDDQAALGA